MQNTGKNRHVGYEALANGIVEQAADDYRYARRVLALPEPGPGADAEKIERYEARIRLAQRRIIEVEKFFLGDWCAQLTSVDGRDMLRKLQRERIRARA